MRVQWLNRHNVHALQAVMQLEKTADGEGNAGDDWAVDVLLRRLADDDAGVVLAVLDSPLLMSIPAAALFDGLSASLQRATAALRSAAADSSGPMGIAKKVSNDPCAVEDITFPLNQCAVKFY